MFELSVACKYLRPRWRQLSVSIISLISIFVIALVVWLIVVFFSVTQGLEKRWVEKLIALTAPLRITPTDTYYHSYYYQIDSISENSNYTLKTIGEKLQADRTDPYDPNSDVEVPAQWAAPDLNADGSLKDPVKQAFAILNNFQLKAKDYEATASNIRLRLLRFTQDPKPQLTQSFLSQSTYLGSLDNENENILKAIQPISEADLNNLFYSLSVNSENSQEETPLSAELVQQELLKERVLNFFNYVKILQLKVPSSGWTIPAALSKGFKDIKRLEGNINLEASVDKESLEKVTSIRKVQFNVTFEKEGQKLSGLIPLGYLQFSKADVTSHFDRTPHPAPFWFYTVSESNQTKQVFLPSDSTLGEGILLPKPFRDAGVLIGDRGYLSFQTPTASTMQEQRVKVFVAGFYDQGLIPIGGKFIFVNKGLTNFIGANQHEGQTQSNGINVRFNDLNQAEAWKGKLQQAFNEAGIAPYWKIETFREYEFTKDIIQQLSSDKHLFTLIATVIIIVACSNIISMLIILVNDKKLEIGILRSMGASSVSIATIFGFCGIVMGITGSLIGISAAVLTLNHLNTLVHILSSIQGHEAFNPLYYGDSLPNEISLYALMYVMGATALISLISGLVPAIKASMMRPSTILRAE